MGEVERESEKERGREREGGSWEFHYPLWSRGRENDGRGGGGGLEGGSRGDSVGKGTRERGGGREG